MNSSNSLGQDPFTNPNNPQPYTPNPASTTGGYNQSNLGPIDLGTPQVVPSIQATQPVNVQLNNELPPLEVSQNPFAQQVSAQPVVTQPVTDPVIQQPVVSQPIVQQPVVLPPIQNIGPIEVESVKKTLVEPKKDSEGKISIALALFIMIGIVLLFALVAWILINNATKQKLTDNVNPTDNIPGITKNLANATVTPSLSEDNPLLFSQVDESRLIIDKPLANQVIPKIGITMMLEGKMKGFFEGTMGYRIVDDNNSIVANGIITAKDDNYDSFSAFSKQIIIAPFTSSQAILGKIEFYETSMKDGTIKVLASIPLKFN